MYKAFLKIGEKHGVAASTVANHFDTPVGPREDGKKVLKRLPSLQSKGSMLPIGVYAFCDGFPPKDREHLFQLVAANCKVKAFMCSPSKAGGDPYTTSASILDALNKAALRASQRPFEEHGRLVVALQQSSVQKTVFFFRRCMPL